MSVTLQPQAPPAGFNVGRVLGEATAIYGRRLWAIALIVLVFMSVPNLVLRWVGVPSSMIMQPLTTLPSYLAGLVVTYLGNWIAISAIADFGLDSAARRPSLLGALGDALRSVPPLLPFRLVADGLPLALLVWIQLRGHGTFASYGAYTVLANFGIWWFWLAISPFVGVVTPVVLAEGRGPVGSLVRSFRLLSSARLPFLAIYFVTHLVFSVTGLMAQVALIGWLRTTGHTPMTYFAESGITGFVLLLLNSTWYVLGAASYQELCRMHGGGSAPDVADVFA